MIIPPAFAQIEIHGVDAASYLQSQLANDVREIAVGHWRFGSYCQVDGRVQVLCICLRPQAERFWLLLPRDCAAQTLERLLKYRMRAKCTIGASDVAIGAPGASSAAIQLRCTAFTWEYTRTAGAGPSLPAELWAQQIALGIPWLEAAVSGKFLPAMLALERLQAFSLRKGCYPGQEILARTHYLGRSKRRLMGIRSGTPGASMVAGSELYLTDGDTPAGSVLGATADATIGLAVISESVPLGACLRTNTNTSADFVIDRNVDAETAADLLNGTLLPD